VNYAELSQAVQDYTQNYERSFVANIPVFVKQAERRIYNTVLFPALQKTLVGTFSINNQYLATPADFLAPLSVAVIDTTGNYDYLLSKDPNFLRAAYPNANQRGKPRYYTIFGLAVTADDTVTTNLSLMFAPSPDLPYELELVYYYYPDTIIQGRVTGFTGLVGGSGYTDGLYYDVPLLGGSGDYAAATVLVQNGSVVNLTITNPGVFYVLDDQLTVAPESIGGFGTGAGFSVRVLSIGNAAGTSWLGDNFDPVLLYSVLVEAYIFMKGEQDVMAYYEKKYQDALQQVIRLGAGLDRGDTYRDGQAKFKVAP
jgi:hypothetical protein